MYSRPEQLIEQYPIIMKSFSKGRDCYLFDTGLETVALHEYFGSKERAVFLAEMLSHFKEKGLLVECILKSTEGEVLVVDEEERKFILTENYKGAECDTSKEEDMVIAAQMLAKLHLLSKTFPGTVPEMIRRNQNTLLEVYERHNKELRLVKNYIRSRKKKNAFEEMFLREYEAFKKKAEDVQAALKGSNISEENYGFCHGDYNQHSIIFAKQGIAVVGLERFTYDLQVRDLANFVRKMMEKHNWDVALGQKLIDAYGSIRPLSGEERRFLYFFLAYPEKFWKLANHYNNGHKTWLSERNIEKLKKVVSQEKEREKFLASFKMNENQLY